MHQVLKKQQSQKKKHKKTSHMVAIWGPSSRPKYRTQEQRKGGVEG